MGTAEIVKFLQTIRFKGVFSIEKYRGEEFQKELSSKNYRLNQSPADF